MLGVVVAVSQFSNTKVRNSMAWLTTTHLWKWAGKSHGCKCQQDQILVNLAYYMRGSYPHWCWVGTCAGSMASNRKHIIMLKVTAFVGIIPRYKNHSDRQLTIIDICHLWVLIIFEYWMTSDYRIFWSWSLMQVTSWPFGPCSQWHSMDVLTYSVPYWLQNPYTNVLF